MGAAAVVPAVPGGSLQLLPVERSWTVRQAMALMLACVVLPVVVASALLLGAHWRGERDKAREELRGEAQALADAIDRKLDVGTGQLRTLAASRSFDLQEWERLHAFAAAAVADRPGYLVGLAAPGGQQVFSTARPYGGPPVNLWALEAEQRQAEWNGHALPVSSQGLTRRVFESGGQAYSGLFYGLNVRRPMLAMAVPVLREGRVAYALLLSYPATAVEEALQQARPGRQVVVADAAGRVIAGRGPGAPSTAEPLPPAVGPDLMAAQVTTAAGYTVRLAAPPAQVLASAVRVISAWAALVVLAVLASTLVAIVFSRWLAAPLQALGESLRPGGAPPRAAGLRVAEVEQLHQVLLAGAQDAQRAADAEAAQRELQQQQRLLRASEAHLRRVLDGLYAFVGVLDLQGTLLEANLTPVQRAGMQREDFIGRPFWDCWWWSWSPAVQERLKLAVERARAGVVDRYDVEVRMEGGQLVTIDFQLAPLRDADGTITHLIPSAVDVQARVQTARALMVSEANAQRAAADFDAQRRLLDATLEATPVGILVLDRAGRLVHMNSANRALWGPVPPEVQPSDWRGWWRDDGPAPGAPIAADAWPLAQALRTGRGVAQTVEIEPFDQPGARRIVHMSAAPVLDAHGAVVGAVVAQLDVTERTLAEATLREADRQKDIFLATLGHELRNPLAPIRTAAEIIRRAAPPEPVLVRARESIERQVAHLSRLVDDLLDVSRIRVGTLQLRDDALDLREIVGGTAEAVRSSVAGRSFVLVPADQPVWVRGDATRLSQALLNVLNNACKFTAPGGHIEVALRTQGRWAEVTVRDDGIGLRPEARERIFGLFTQEEKSGLGGNQGLGIGLALSRQLARLHGGDLVAHSDGPGRGSTFVLRLPLAEAGAQAAAGEAPTPAPARAEATVLVVDDNQDSCDLLAELLEGGGLHVLKACTGAEALRLHAAHGPELVVLDIGLPDIDGYQLCRRIRADRPAHPPALVALTGWGQAADKAAARAAGFDVHLTKPVDPIELERTLRLLLQAKGTFA
jgi:PAS domain S-box-containing protein